MRVTLAQRAASLLITTTLAAVPAWAQTTGSQTSPDSGSPSTVAPSHGPGHHGHRSAANRPQGEDLETLVEARIADLHSKLHITPQQTEQWNQFAEVMRGNAKDMDQLYKDRAAKLSAMSAVDNMQSYAQIEGQRAQQMQKLVPAFQTLYASLSTEQKAEADRLFQNRAARAEARRGHPASVQ